VEINGCLKKRERPGKEVLDNVNGIKHGRNVVDILDYFLFVKVLIRRLRGPERQVGKKYYFLFIVFCCAG